MEPRSCDRGKASGLTIIAPDRKASMEPRSCDRGKATVIASHAIFTVLQWSRGPVTAESRALERKTKDYGQLQWSRGPVTAESVMTFYARDLQKPASMEPRSCDRGKPPSSSVK